MITCSACNKIDRSECMITYELRFALALIWTALAAYFDIFNNKTVPSWVTYSLLVVAALINITAFNIMAAAIAFLPAIAILIIGYFAYRIGQVGGADVLLFAGLALMLPFRSALGYPIIVSIALWAISLALIGIAIGAIGKANIRKIKPSELLLGILFFAAYAAFIYISSPLLSEFGFVFFAALALSSFFLVSFRTELSKSMIKMVGIRQIDDEDVLAVELMDEKLVKKFSLRKLITKKELEKLKKTGLKKFPVYKGMPAFVPYILLGLLLFLIAGDPIKLIFH